MHNCKFCNKTFETGQKLGGHIVVHKDYNILCKVCNTEVHSRTFKVHTKACEKLHDRSANCESCNQPIQKSKRFCSSSCAAKKLNSLTPARSDSIKQKISESLSGRINNPARYQDRNCRNCNNLFTPSRPTLEPGYCSVECRKAGTKRNLSISLKGKTGGIRERGGIGKGDYYKGVWLDSSWEIKYASYLDENNIRWERVKERFPYKFEDKGFNYIPDFFLPDKNLYVEIKGFVTDRDKAKWKYFPHSLEVLKKDELKQMGII
jgi:hypothetical protein